MKRRLRLLVCGANSLHRDPYSGLIGVLRLETRKKRVKWLNRATHRVPSPNELELSHGLSALPSSLRKSELQQQIDLASAALSWRRCLDRKSGV